MFEDDIKTTLPFFLLFFGLGNQGKTLHLHFLAGIWRLEGGEERNEKRINLSKNIVVGPRKENFLFD